MTIDWTKPVETKLGIHVTVISMVGRNPTHPVLVYKGDSGILLSYTKDGSGEYGEKDLRNVKPKPRQAARYINVYTDDVISGFLSRISADMAAAQAETVGGQKRIACKKVVFTEGEYDE